MSVRGFLRQSRPWVRRFGLGLGAFLVLFSFAWVIAPFCVQDPMTELERHTPVRVWKDTKGRVVWYERTFDGEWRFPVALEEIPEEVRAFTLNTEDARFYDHGGVDYRAALRALCQDICAGRVLSGASTISMQVAGLAYPRRSWRWGRKFLQAARARKLERCHTKAEILAAYFNHLPYGGKIVGIKSAAERFFGLKVSELTVAEASLLVGVPQAPNRFRPDIYPEAARRRQRMVLDFQVRKGLLTTAAADAIFDRVRLRYRDFALTPEWEEKGEAKEWLFVTNALDTVDSELCADVKRILERRLGEGVRDAAAVVLDAKSGATRAYVGTMDFDSPQGGQVDAARAIRSAGSTLKPFIYLEAIKGGIITPETKLLDAPLRYGSYAPANFDGEFRGEITATEALSHSLNTPVIRLLAKLGEGRVRDAFDRVGLVGTVKTNGLSLALGSAGYRLVDIAAAYRTLTETATDNWAVVQSKVMLSKMLRTLPMPGAPDLDVAWKTGTSNNLKDAWCFAYTPDWVVGVWYGNKSGRANKRLVGVEIAAPAAGEIMSFLYENAAPPKWREPMEEGFRGLRFEERKGAEKQRFAIISPAAETYSPSPGDTKVKLDLTTTTEGSYWYWNGAGLGKVTTAEFPPGHHRLIAVSPDPDAPAVSVEFQVSIALPHL